MAIKVLIKRKIADGKLNEASKLLYKARYNAMGQPGYISSETLSGIDNPNIVVVVSMWQKIENWDLWKNSNVRAETEVVLEALLDGQTEYEAYNLGMNL
ncbi:antibiotic biosynthesis monooxygenase family protein [Thermodesulfobacteriota bacterium]